MSGFIRSSKLALFCTLANVDVEIPWSVGGLNSELSNLMGVGWSCYDQLTCEFVSAALMVVDVTVTGSSGNTPIVA
ncbi:hypothetical protein E4U55_004634 [Claviceps digitariae]|nr:hypothetical protein E4U55_004634 [Claviceps digitariae]